MSPEAIILFRHPFNSPPAPLPPPRSASPSCQSGLVLSFISWEPLCLLRSRAEAGGASGLGKWGEVGESDPSLRALRSCVTPGPPPPPFSRPLQLRNKDAGLAHPVCREKGFKNKHNRRHFSFMSLESRGSERQVGYQPMETEM